MLPCPGCCKQCYNEHWGACVFVCVCVCVCVCVSRNGISGSILSFLRNLQTWRLGSKESAYSAGDCLWCRRHEFDPWAWKIIWRKKWKLIPVFLPGMFHGQRSLVGYSSMGHKNQTWLNNKATEAAPTCIPTNGVQGSFSSHPCQYLCSLMRAL